MSSQKFAIITGASRGLGRSMASHLAQAGVGIIGTYHSRRDEADSLAAEIEQRGVPAAMLQLDTADTSTFSDFTASVGQLLHGFGEERFDYLNSAGAGVSASFAETTEQQFDKMIALNVKGPFFLTQALLPLLADGARVLNVSSGLARFVGPGYAAYASAKGAVEVMTRYQAQELGARDIRVNVVAPGAIATDFGGGVVRDNKQVNQMVAGATALGRVGEPDDIGAAVAAILSDGFAWASGTRIELSGGQSL